MIPRYKTVKQDGGAYRIMIAVQAVVFDSDAPVDTAVPQGDFTVADLRDMIQNQQKRIENEQQTLNAYVTYVKQIAADHSDSDAVQLAKELASP